MLTLEPLGGCRSDSAPAYLLELDSARILLDCGCLEGGTQQDVDDETATQRRAADAAYLARLKEIAPTLTLVLLSHPKPTSLGLLPLLITHYNLSPSCMIYASPPTLALGRLALLEWLSARTAEEDAGLQPDTVVSRADEAASALAKEPAPWKISTTQLLRALGRITTIRFNSPVLLSGRNAPLTLVASRSGHTLGGTLWTLRTPTNDEVLYAPVFNHVREKALDGAEVGAGATASSGPRTRRRAYVVAGAERSLVTAPKALARNRSILDMVTATLKSGHSVLIPCDASARVIELLILLDQHWAFSDLGESFPFCLVSKTGRELPLALKNMAEFLGVNMQNPQAQGHLRLSQVRFFASPAELHNAIPASHPKLILAAPASLSYGFSRRLFTSFATDTGNVVLLTSRGEPGSLTRLLFERWQGSQSPASRWGNEAGKIGGPVDLAESIELQLNLKRPLIGQELHAHAEKVQAVKAAEDKQRALAERSRRLREAAGQEQAESDSSDDEDGPSGARGVNGVAADGADGDVDGDAEREVLSPLTNGKVGGLSEDAVVPVPRAAGNWDEFVDGGDAQPIVGAGFDTYVRGQVTRRLEYSTPAPGAPADDRPIAPTRLRTFAFIERRRRVDQYGEVVDVAGWLSRGRTQEMQQATSNATSSADFGLHARDAMILGKRKREEEEAEKPEEPHRFVSETVNVQARCTVFVVDMEGKADGRALKTLLPNMNPKKLVLINGDDAATDNLRQALESNAAFTRDVFTPKVGEHVHIADDVKSFSVKLDDGFVGTLDMRRVEGYEIVRVSGAVSFSDESSIPTLAASSTLLRGVPVAAAKTNAPALAPLYLAKTASPSAEQSGMDVDDDDDAAQVLPPLPASLWIGDLKLAALKRRLTAAGIPAAFAGEGVLVCGPVAPAQTAAASAEAKAAEAKAKSLRAADPRRRPTAASRAKAETPEPELNANDRVAVRKKAEGQLVIEGPVGETMTRVRTVIYSCHASAG